MRISALVLSIKAAIFCTGILIFSTGCGIKFELTDLRPPSVAPNLSETLSPQFVFDEDHVEQVGGFLQLKALDFSESGEDFDQGLHLGSQRTTQDFLSLQVEAPSVSSNLSNILPLRFATLGGYWRFDGDLSDQTSGGNNGTFFGDARYHLKTPVEGQSLLLDGSGDYIRIPHSSTFEVSLEGFTVSALIHPFYAVGNGRIVDKRGRGLGGLYPGWQLLIRDNGEGRWNFAQSGIDDGQGLFVSASDTESSFAYGRWYHVAMTYEVGDGLSFFVNGQLHEKVPVADYGSLANTLPLTVGSGVAFNGLEGSVAQGFTGFIDEVSFYQVPLSSDEIRQIANQLPLDLASDRSLREDGVTPWANLVGYWPMDDHAMDVSGHGHHGEIFSNAQFVGQSVGQPINPALTQTQVGTHAAAFDGDEGTIGRVELSSNPTLDNLHTSNYSISAWVRPNRLPSATNSSNDRFGLVIKHGSHIGLAYNSSGRFVFNTREQGNSPQSVFSKIKPFGSYYFVVGTLDYTLGVLRIYVNGVLEDESTFDGTVLDLGANIWTIGAESGGGAQRGPSDALIDDVALWSKALSPQQIQYIYRKQKQKFFGSYLSSVFDWGQQEQSSLISWKTPLPFGKELLGDTNGDGSPESDNTDEYKEALSSLNQGLIGYWPMNEPQWSGVPSEVLDHSGKNRHGTLVGNNSTVNTSVFKGQNSGYFGGGTVAHAISVGSSADLIPSADHPISIFSWVRADEIGSTGSVANRVISIHRNLSGNASGLAFGLGDGDKVQAFIHDGVAGETITSGSSVSLGRWHFIGVVYDGSCLQLFINGQADGSCVSTGLAAGSAAPFYLGGFDATFNRVFHGLLSETAVWNRPLSLSEISSLYRRGANRVSLQWKSCIDVTCQCHSYSSSPQGDSADCDGDGILNTFDFSDEYKAQFVGPGGDESTAFSEVYNRKPDDLLFNCDLNSTDSDSLVCVADEISFGGRPSPQSPLFSVEDFNSLVLPRPNRYLQYQVTLEAEDNLACNGQPCWPEVLEVRLASNSAPRFFGQTQTVTAQSPIKYEAILSADIESDPCATFQLSPDGQSFYNWSGSQSRWTLVDSPQVGTSAQVTRQNIVRFSEQFGPGSLYVKAFLNSDTRHQCAIRQVNFNVVSSPLD